MVITFDELLASARSVVSPRRLSPHAEAGGVGAAVLSAGDTVYTGVCIDTGSSMGFCAEHAAAAAMVTAGESRVLKMVAVGSDGGVMAPCGRCREFVRQLDDDNDKAEVMVAEGVVVALSDLLPFRRSADDSRRLDCEGGAPDVSRRCIAVVTTVGSLEQARALARSLVEADLAACAQIGEIESWYRWDDAVRQDREYRVVFKTTLERYRAVEDAIAARHPYDLPEIHACVLDHVSPAYAAWVERSVAAPDAQEELPSTM